jgi:hypothetical protein
MAGVGGQGRGPRPDLHTAHWRRTRKTILERDAYECQIRGTGCSYEATEVDHIRPNAFGGDDHPDNLRAACKRCNSALGAGARGGRFLTSASHPSPPQLPVSPQRPVSGVTRGVWHLDLPV